MGTTQKRVSVTSSPYSQLHQKMADVQRDRQPLDIFGVTRSGASEEVKSLFLLVFRGFGFNKPVSFMITDTKPTAKG